jgi:hypothetical protein
MTKLAELAPLFEMTAAERRQMQFDAWLAVKIDPLAQATVTPDDVALADARTQEYDRAARRHQLWLARFLESRGAEAQ